jgi:3-oxoacyl-[acyl-carrier protein] reductase
MAKEGAHVVTNNRKKGSTGTAIVKDTLLDRLSEDQKGWLQTRIDAETGDAESTADLIRKAGGEAIPFFGDISDFHVAEELIRKAIDGFGKIDILVNVAGTFGFSPIWEMTEEMWDRVTVTKPKGYFNTMRHAIPHMMRQRWGRIINCTSRAFTGDALRHAEYSTANAGVVGLTKAAAKELFEYGITCNAFAPLARTRASFELDAYDMAVGEERSPWLNKKWAFPMDKAPGSDQIVPFIVYLATEAAARVSGSVFDVGGNAIGLFSEPEITKNLVKYGDPWTLDEITQQAPLTLLAGYHGIGDIEYSIPPSEV